MPGSISTTTTQTWLHFLSFMSPSRHIVDANRPAQIRVAQHLHSPLRAQVSQKKRSKFEEGGLTETSLLDTFSSVYLVE